MISPAKTEFHSARAAAARAGSITSDGSVGTRLGTLSTPSPNSHAEGTNNSQRPKEQAMASGGTRLWPTSAQPASTTTAKPRTTALIRPALTRVVDNTSGESTSQPPTA